MEVFYEESSTPRNSVKEKRKYNALHITSRVFLILGILAIFIGVTIIPMDASWILWGFICIWLFSSWLIFGKWKKRFHVSYDYCFVSGELRIAKVLNTMRRKLVVRFDCQEIIQFGDVDSPAYERFAASPDVKTVLCTSNVEAAEGKFFMYILIENNGKKLYVLECRETLLINILKFVKRTLLDSDYVMQEKKQRQ